MMGCHVGVIVLYSLVEILKFSVSLFLLNTDGRFLRLRRDGISCRSDGVVLSRTRTLSLLTPLSHNYIDGYRSTLAYESLVET